MSQSSQPPHRRSAAHRPRPPVNAAPPASWHDRALFEGVDQGSCVVEILYDPDGRPWDYRFLEVNPTFERHTGLTDAAGKTARELVPGLEDHWVETYARVSEIGEPCRFEQGSAAMGRWFAVEAVPVGGAGSGRVALLFTDVTERRRVEAALRESVERARLAVRVARFGTWRYDLATDLVEFDERMREIWGEPVDAATIPLPTVLERIHPDDRARVAHAIAAALDPGSLGAYDIDYRLLLPGATERWVTANGQAEFAGDGAGRTPVSFTGTALDITARKRAEADLRYQTTLLEALTESVLDGILMVSPDGRMLHANRHFREIWNFPPEILESRSDARALAWAARQTADPAAFLARVTDIYGQPERQVREEMALKDGRVFERFGAPIHEGHARLGWLWMFRDITEQKRHDGNAAVLAAIAEEIARPLSATEIMRVFAEQIGGHLGVSRCLFTQYDAADDRWSVVHEWLGDGETRTAGPHGTAAFVAADGLGPLAAGHQLAVVDTATDPRTAAARDAFADLGAGAFVTTPYLSDGRWTSTVTVHRRAAYAWRTDELDLLREVASRAWPRIERARAEAALRAGIERQRLALAIAQAGAWEWDLAVDRVTGDASLARLFDLRAEEVTGGRLSAEAFFRSIHPDDRPRVDNELRDVFATGGEYETEYRVVGDAGATRWLAARGRVDVAAGGQAERVTGLVFDVSGRKQSELDTAMLAELGEHIRLGDDADTLLETVARLAGRHLGASRGFFIAVDEAADRLTVTRDYRSTADVASAAGDYRISSSPPVVVAALRAGRVVEVRDTVEDPRTAAFHAASYHPLGIRAFAAVPLPRGGDWVLAFAAFSSAPRNWQPRETALLETVAERTWNAIEKLRLSAALRAAEEDRERLLDALAHDLKNPLAVLKGQAQLLRRRNARDGGVDSTALDERVAVIEGIATRMTGLVDELGDHARLAAGQPAELRPEPTELVALVRDVVAEVVPTGELPTIRIETSDVELVGSWDPGRLRRVVSNLLGNAVKYSPGGDEVLVRLARENGEAVLRVRDTGIGIPAADLPHVFAFRRRAGNVAMFAGSGIGLAGAKWIVDQLGGTIALESEEGAGTVATVRLPLVAPSSG